MEASPDDFYAVDESDQEEQDPVEPGREGSDDPFDLKAVELAGAELGEPVVLSTED